MGNLDYHTTSNDIHAMFSAFGKVVDVYFPRDKNRKPPKLTSRERNPKEPISYGCAFVEFQCAEDAKLIRTMEQPISDPYERVVYISSAEKK